MAINCFWLIKGAQQLYRMQHHRQRTTMHVVTRPPSALTFAVAAHHRQHLATYNTRVFSYSLLSRNFPPLTAIIPSAFIIHHVSSLASVASLASLRLSCSIHAVYSQGILCLWLNSSKCEQYFHRHAGCRLSLSQLPKASCFRLFNICRMRQGIGYNSWRFT